MSEPSVTIAESREVSIFDLPDGLISVTPAGRAPIRCVAAWISYGLPDGRLSSVLVRGHLVDDRDIRRRGRALRSGGYQRAAGAIDRRYAIDWRTRTADLPTWLAELVERYRPASGGATPA